MKSGEKGFGQRGPGLKREMSLLIENVKLRQFGQLGHSVQKRGVKSDFDREEVGRKGFWSKMSSSEQEMVSFD